MIEPRYDTFWPRFWAGFVDGLVFMPVAAVDFVAYRDGVLLRCIWYVVASFGFSAYVVLMHARYGQTLGKMANHVRVLDISESKLSGRQADLLGSYFDEVILMLDADEAGKAGATAAATALSSILVVQIVELASGTQPDQLASEEINQLLGGFAHDLPTPDR